MKNQRPKDTSTIAPPVNERHEEAVSRSNCYGFLALIFRDVPTPELIAQLRTPPLVETLSQLGYEVTKDVEGKLEAVSESLSEQYTRAFVGPGPHVLPYASIHLDGQGRLWGESTVWVNRFIEATGLSFRDNWDSIPDHIAVELELMQRLAGHEAELWVQIESSSPEDKKALDERLYRCLQLQEDFLRDHLCLWIPQFCERVLEISASAFYGQMAGLKRSIVSSDLSARGNRQTSGK